MERVNSSGELHVIPAVVRDHFSIRFCVCKEDASIDDMKVAWCIFLKYIDPQQSNPSTSNKQSTTRFSLTKDVKGVCSSLKKGLYDGGTPVFISKTTEK